MQSLLRFVFKQRFEVKLLQALIDNNDDEVDGLLRRRDVKTWINSRVELKELKRHNITQDGLKWRNERVDKIEEFETILGYVCTYKSAECLMQILSAGADVSIKSAYGNTCLHRVCLSNVQSFEKFELLSRFLDNDIDSFSATNAYSYGVIHYAAISENWMIPENILKMHNLDFDVRGSRKITALYLSAAFGHINCVRVFIESGASVDAEDENGWNALHYASCHGKVECVELLLNSNANTIRRS